MSIVYEKYYNDGLFKKVRTMRFDSESESIICLILNHILQDYDLEKYMQIRLTPQQALDNYVYEKNEVFLDYYKNKHKWMKFDFIFEQVYEYKNKMAYLPVAVVEFDGPHHNFEEQKKLDEYKNGVISNIGAGLVRIKYDELDSLDEIEVRSKYERDIMLSIIKGYFTPTTNFRKSSEFLINEKNQKKFDCLIHKYKRACEESNKKNNKIEYYGKMLSYLQYAKEHICISSN